MKNLVGTNGSITTQNLNTGSGTPTTGSYVQVPDNQSGTTMGPAPVGIPADASVATISVSGTYTGPLTPRGSLDGVNWFTLSSTAITNLANGTTSGTIGSGATGLFTVGIAGLTWFRLDAESAVTGAAFVSINISSASVTLSVTASPVLSSFSPSRNLNVLTNSTLGLNSIYMVPFQLADSVYVSHLDMFASVATTLAAANSTDTAGLTLSCALYSRLGSASTDQIGTIWSGSQFISISMTSNTALTIAAPSGYGSASTTLAATNASTYFATRVAGFREFAYQVGSTLPPGDYWFAAAFSSQSNDATCVVNASILQETYSNQIAFQPFGGASSASNASFPQFNQGLGVYSATSGAFPATIALTGGVITNAPSAGSPIFQMRGFATNASEN